MRRHHTILFASLILGTALLPGVAPAEIPNIMAWQGVALDSTGAALEDGDYTLTFRIYDAATGGSILWTESQLVPVADGIMNVLIGAVDPVPPSVFSDTARFLEVQFESESPYAPRTRMASVGYAYRTGTIDRATGGDILGSTHIYNSIWGGRFDVWDYGEFNSTQLIGEFRSTLGLGSQLRFSGAGGGFIDIGQDGSGHFVVESSDSPRLTVTTSGAVGIGTTSPAASLDVAGGIYSSGGYNRFHATTDNSSGNSGFGGGPYGNVKLAVHSTQDYGIYVDAPAATQNALYVLGTAAVSGTLSKGGGSFKIDHPLDPDQKYLQHSFVESPDMMNIYNGNVVTDARGFATVTLPDYFEALNRDYRYQLTVIGTFSQAIVARKIENLRFVIQTDKPNVEVSWQVTGIRQDPFANAYRIPVESLKSPAERGLYLHPEALGQSPDRNVARLQRAVESSAGLD